MNDEEIAQLQDDSEWDFEAGERQRAPRGHRAVVSVGFKTADFTLVSEAARERDQPVSQFIREAALDRARERAAQTVSHGTITIRTSHSPRQVDVLLAGWMQSHGRMLSLR